MEVYWENINVLHVAMVPWRIRHQGQAIMTPDIRMDLQVKTTCLAVRVFCSLPTMRPHYHHLLLRLALIPNHLPQLPSLITLAPPPRWLASKLDALWTTEFPRLHSSMYRPGLVSTTLHLLSPSSLTSAETFSSPFPPSQP